MWFIGGLYVLAGIGNLFGIVFMPEVQEQAISLESMVVRYSFYIVIGIGMVMLKKWSAFVLAVSVLVNWVIFFTVYEGKSGIAPWQYSLIGPVLLAALYYYTWPVLTPSAIPQEKSADDA